MARAATAYVAIKPDFGDFFTKVSERIRAYNPPDITVKIKPDVAKLDTALKTALTGLATKEAQRAGANIGDTVSTSAAKSVKDKMTPLMRVQLEHAARDMVETYKKNFGADHLIDEDTIRGFEKKMVDKFGLMGARMGRSQLAGYNREVIAEWKRTEAKIVAQANKLSKDLDKLTADAAKASAKSVREAEKAAADAGKQVVREAEKVARDAAKAAEKAVRATEKAAADAGKRVVKDAEQITRDAAKAAKRAADEAKKAADRIAKDNERLRASFAKLFSGGGGSKFAGLSRLQLILAAAASVAAPLAKTISSLAGAFVSLAAAAGQVGAAFGGGALASVGAFGQAFTAVAISIRGMKDASKSLNEMLSKQAAGVALTKADVNAYHVAMAKLSPAARQAVLSLAGVNLAVQRVGKTVSQHLFAAFGADIRRVAGSFLPLLRTNLSATADVLSHTGRSLSRYLTRSSTVGMVGDIMAGNTRIVKEYAKAFIPLLDVALRLWRAFQPLAEQLAAYTTAWAKNLDTTTQAKERSGALADTVARLGKMMSTFRSLVAHAFDAVKNTFNAVSGTGGTLLEMLDRLVTRWDNWTKSMAGRSAITRWAEDSIPVMSALGRLIGDIFKVFTDLAAAGDAVGFIDQLRSVVPPLGELLKQLSQSNAVGRFAVALSDIMTSLGKIGVGSVLAEVVLLMAELVGDMAKFVAGSPSLIFALKALVILMTSLAAIRFVSMVTGLTSVLKLTGSILLFKKAFNGLPLTMKQSERSAAILGTRLRTMTSEAGSARGAIGNLLGSFKTGLWIAAAAGIAIGIGALNDMIEKARAARLEAAALKTDLGQTGATDSSKAAAKKLDELKGKIDAVKEAASWNNEDTHTLTAAQAADVAQLQAQYDKFAATVSNVATLYGKDTDAIIAANRRWGLDSSVTDDQIIAKIGEIAAAHKGQKLSAQDMASAVAESYHVVGTSVDAVANSTSWPLIAQHTQEIKGYLVDMANAGISANSQLMDSLAAMGEQAYRTGNEINQLQFEKMVGRGIKGKLPAALPKPKKIKKVAEYIPPVGDSFTAAATNAGKKAGVMSKAGYLSTLVPAMKNINWVPLLKINPSTGKALYKVGANVVDLIAKGITSGRGNLDKVSRFLTRAKAFRGAAGYVRKIQAAIDNYTKSLTVYDAVAKKAGNLTYWQNIRQGIVDLQSKISDALTSNRGLVGFFGFIPTPEEVQAQLDKQLNQLITFRDQLNNLANKGLDKNLLAEWAAGGPDQAGNPVLGLQNATKDQIDRINASFQGIGTTANQIASDTATAMYGYGLDTVDGFIKGIQSRSKAAADAVTKVILDAVAAGKKALKAKSPSQVFAAMGADSMAGYQLGVTGSAGIAVGAVASVMKDVAATPAPVLAASFARPSASALAGMADRPPVVNVRVYVGDREITDIVRVEYQRADEYQARRLLSSAQRGA